MRFPDDEKKPDKRGLSETRASCGPPLGDIALELGERNPKHAAVAYGAELAGGNSAAQSLDRNAQNCSCFLQR